jgi:hypothetical protein
MYRLLVMITNLFVVEQHIGLQRTDNVPVLCPEAVQGTGSVCSV